MRYVVGQHMMATSIGLTTIGISYLVMKFGAMLPRCSCQYWWQPFNANADHKGLLMSAAAKVKMRLKRIAAMRQTIIVASRVSPRSSHSGLLSVPPTNICHTCLAAADPVASCLGPGPPTRLAGGPCIGAGLPAA